MKQLSKPIIALGILSMSLTNCKKDHPYHPADPQGGGTPSVAASVTSAAGDSATVIGTINVFRNLLGDSLNTVPGKTSGRREVNWDAVPAAFTNNGNFPGDFFNSTVATDPAGRKRGLVMTTTGTGFLVDSTAYSGVDASYANQFDIFSRKRLFTTLGTNITVVNFKVPGTSTDAFVKGFGVIFSDVDNEGPTTLEFFSGNTSIGVFKAAPHPASGKFSFLGVKFKDATVTKVIITSGSGSISTGVKDVSDGGANDLVVMDDFFYDEPNPTQK